MPENETQLFTLREDQTYINANSNNHMHIYNAIEVEKSPHLNGMHTVFHVLHGHFTTEDGGHSQIAAIVWIARSHKVFGVEHLLSQVSHG